MKETVSENNKTVIRNEEKLHIPTLVSVIIPVYKVEPYLRICANSVLTQTYQHLDIILVDDGSPDKCPQICDEYATNDPRINVIHKQNGGLSDARNAGLAAAKGDWIMYVDSDDYIEPDAVKRLLQVLPNNADDVDIICGAAKEININGTTHYLRHSNIEPNKIYSSQEYILHSSKIKEFFVPAWQNLYRKTFLDKFDHFFTVDIYYEDMDLIPRIFFTAKNIIYSDYPFYNYIKRDGSITTAGDIKKRYESAKIIWQNLFNAVTDIEDRSFQRKMYRWFSNIYLSMTGTLGITENFYPQGMAYSFLLKYNFDFRDLLKALLLGLSREKYISLYQRHFKIRK